MKLGTINRFLGYVGLVLVVWVPTDTEQPISFHLTTRRAYERRNKGN